MAERTIEYVVPRVASGRTDVWIESGELAGVTVIAALAVLLESAALATVTATVVLTLTCGAVKRPLVEIVPAEADQVTAVLLVPETVAENCCCPPDASGADEGEIRT